MRELINKSDVLKAQSMYVVKGNDLIQKSRYSLTLMEQKAILYLISKIKPTDSDDTVYVFNIKDFIKACNFYTKGGFHYHYIKDLLIELAKRVITIETPKGDIITHWFNDAIMSKESGELTITFSNLVRPYLFELKSFYTQYSLEFVLPMRSKYGIRLYELLVSVHSKGYRQTFELEELKKRIDCDKYEYFKDFRVYVLEPAIEDINTYTDLNVSYTLHKTGRKYTHIEFVAVKYFDAEGERQINRRKVLGSIYGD